MLSLIKSHMNPLLLGEPAMHLRARAETDAANRHFAEEYSKESRYVAQPLVNLALMRFSTGTKTNRGYPPNLWQWLHCARSDTSALASQTAGEEDRQSYEEIF